MGEWVGNLEKLDKLAKQRQQIRLSYSEQPSFTLLFILAKEEEKTNVKKMLVLRETPSKTKYYILRRDLPGTMLAAKNHQGGFDDSADESHGKILVTRIY